jgi:hypothetical protein
MYSISSFIGSVHEEIHTLICGVHTGDYEEYSCLGCNAVVQRKSKVLDEHITSIFRVEE